MDDFDKLKARFETRMAVPASPSLPSPGTSPRPLRTDLQYPDRPGAAAPVEVRVGSDVRIRQTDAPPSVLEDIKTRLTFRNPMHRAQERAGKVRPGVTPYLMAWYAHNGDLAIARGWTADLLRILQAHRLQPSIADHTICPKSVGLSFRGRLYAYQAEAVRDVVSKKFGIVSGNIGCGKKVLALYLVARFQTPALVIVRYRWQLYQWAEMARIYLGADDGMVGIVGDGKARIDYPLVIGTDKSLYRVIDKLSEKIGFLVVDRCDFMQFNAYFKLVTKIRSCRMLGLATSPKRDDGLTQMMCAYIGPVVHRIPIDRVQSELQLCPPELTVRETAFDYNFRDDYSDMISAIARDEARNRLIITDILAETADPSRRALVVCDRKAQLERFQEMLTDNFRGAAVVTADTKEKPLANILYRFDNTDLQVICVTAKSVSKVESGRIDRVFMASPVHHAGHVAQAVSKIVRKGPEPARIFDYLDRPNHLKGVFQRRKKVYQAFNIKTGGI